MSLWSSPTHSSAPHLMQRQYVIPQDLEVSAPCRALLARMLTPDPDQRWGAEQVSYCRWDV